MRIQSSSILTAAYELDAMATVYRDLKGRFRIAVHPDSKHVGDEYFKLYNSTSIESATKIARSC